MNYLDRKNYFIFIISCAFILLIMNSCPEQTVNNKPCLEFFKILEELKIDSIDAPSPITVGSKITINGQYFLNEPQCVQPYFILRGKINNNEIETILPVNILNLNEAYFVFNDDLLELLGVMGTFSGEIEVQYLSIYDDQSFSSKIDFSFELVPRLLPEITDIGQGNVYLNDLIIVEGENFVFGDEGNTQFIISGDFTPKNENEGQRFHIDYLEVNGIKDQGEYRDITGFLLSPELSHLRLGTFSGSVRICNVHYDQQKVCSNETADVTWHMQESYIEQFDPQTFSLGQIVSINGRGFVGGDNGVTVIRLKGYFEIPLGYNMPIDKGIVPLFFDNSTLLYTVVVTTDGTRRLMSSDFMINRGVFNGEIYVMLIYNSYEREIGPFDLSFTLGLVKQIFYVRFNDDFSESLELFGLRAVEEEIKKRSIDKMSRVYINYNVEFRTEEPDDFYEGGYGIIDIYGRDPYGYGIFGYDNSGPGKDSYNLRLHDRIGGINAMTQPDGYQGYGGVFMDSFLFYSDHPGLDYSVEQPPELEPEFDIIFDPVRYHEVSAGEYPDDATGTRLQEIENAINTLGNLIGDTAAHEIGHSLGLANPNIQNRSYHRIIPQDGCLMDAGGDRPFDERIEADDNTGGHFCGEEINYLNEILPLN